MKSKHRAFGPKRRASTEDLQRGMPRRTATKQQKRTAAASVMVLDGFRIPAKVVTLFERISLHIIEAGHRRYSAQGVLEQIRWHVAMEKRGQYKINNNWSAPLARWFLAKHPELSGFFETRQQRSKEPTS